MAAFCVYIFKKCKIAIVKPAVYPKRELRTVLMNIPLSGIESGYDMEMMLKTCELNEASNSKRYLLSTYGMAV